MSEKTNETKEQKSEQNNDILCCIRKQSVHYYKIILLYGGGCILVAGLAYAILMAVIAILPELIKFIGEVPLIAYPIIAVTVGPFILAVIVCLDKQHQNKIKQIESEDDDLICKE